MTSARESNVAAQFRLASLLARISLERSFRRSIFGPFWNSVGVLIAVVAIGLLFGTVLRQQLRDFDSYVLELATGLVLWAFLSGVVNESCVAFARWMPVLRHAKVAPLAVGGSILLRHLPVLFVNLLMLIVLQFVLAGIAPAPLQMVLATSLLIFGAAALGSIVLVLGARFRDIGQLVPAAMQLSFLMTPILWPPYFLGRFEYLLLFNPFNHLLSVFRSASMGMEGRPLDWALAVAVTGCGAVLAAALYRYAGRQRAYWI